MSLPFSKKVKVGQPRLSGIQPAVPPLRMAIDKANRNAPVGNARFFVKVVATFKRVAYSSGLWLERSSSACPLIWGHPQHLLVSFEYLCHIRDPEQVLHTLAQVDQL
jgi:hypothetical protein